MNKWREFKLHFETISYEPGKYFVEISKRCSILKNPKEPTNRQQKMNQTDNRKPKIMPFQFSEIIKDLDRPFKKLQHFRNNIQRITFISKGVQTNHQRESSIIQKEFQEILYYSQKNLEEIRENLQHPQEN